MKEYEYDKATVDAWLKNGGAEIVLETLRHLGWDIEILTGDDWQYMDDFVVVADREGACMEINGKKRPWDQAFFAVLVQNREHSLRNGPPAYRGSRSEFMFPMLSKNDKFYEPAIYLCYHFIDRIRASSEATIACMTAVSATGKENV